MLRSQQTHSADGEGGAGTAGNGKEGADGKIQQGAEEHTVFLSNFFSQRNNTVTAAHTQSHNSQHGDANGRDKYTQKSTPKIAACINAHFGGENQISCTKEHAKQHTGNGDGFFEGQISFHKDHPFGV